MLSKTKLATLIISTGAMFASPIANADPSWPDLFREAALPKTSSVPSLVSYDVEIIQKEDDEWGKLKYNVESRPETDIQITVDSYPTKAKQDEVKNDLLAKEELDIWCDNHDSVVGGNVELVSETETEAQFSFPVNVEKYLDKREKKMMEKTVVTVTIDKDIKEVTRFEYSLTSPFKPAVVAKVTKFELMGTCKSHASGRPIVEQISISLEGKAMGQSFSQNTLQTFSDVSIDMP